MEEKRYDFSFMKEYQELYEVSDLELASIFKCGTKKVQDVISGKIKIKESVVEEILYDIGFSSYEKYKENIQNKINRKKEVLKLQEEKKKLKKSTNIKSVEKQPIKKEEYVEEKTKEEPINIDIAEEKTNYISMLDLKNMTNKDILINVLLFGNVVNKEPNEIASFLNIGEDYVLYIHNQTTNLVGNKVKQKN